MIMGTKHILHSKELSFKERNAYNLIFAITNQRIFMKFYSKVYKILKTFCQ